MPSLKSVVDSDVNISKIASGFIRAEGPVWIPEIGILRWSDLPRRKTFDYQPSTKSISEYLASDDFINGRSLDNDGFVIQCSHGKRRIERDRHGTIERLAHHYNGAQLNSPNDLVIARDGAIWFTDPPYGIEVIDEGRPGVQEYADSFLFRFDPRTEKLRPVIIDIETPNGLAFSPDESILYVSDTSALFRTDGTGNHHIRSYDVIDKRCKNGRIFAQLDTLPNGIRVDALGNIWVCTSRGVEIFAPDSSPLGIIELPEPASNLCFGGADGQDLYICATTSLYHLRTYTNDAARK